MCKHILLILAVILSGCVYTGSAVVQGSREIFQKIYERADTYGNTVYRGQKISGRWMSVEKKIEEKAR